MFMNQYNTWNACSQNKLGQTVIVFSYRKRLELYPLTQETVEPSLILVQISLAIHVTEPSDAY